MIRGVAGKEKNRTVVGMYKGQPHIRTEIVMLTPIAVEDMPKFRMMLGNGELEAVIKDTIDTVRDKMTDTFEGDIEMVSVSMASAITGGHK